MKTVLRSLVIIAGLLSSSALADGGCAYRLISWIGFNGTGFNSISGAEPGDVLLSVVSTAGDGVEYVTSFTRKVQNFPIALGVLVGVEQTSSANLSSTHLIGLICRQEAGSK